MKLLLTLIVLLIAIVEGSPSASAGQLFAFHGAGWKSFVVLDDALVNRLTEHDLTLLRLALQRHLFREMSPLSRETQQPAAAVFQQPSDNAELDQVIQRLGILIREAEREEKAR